MSTPVSILTMPYCTEVLRSVEYRGLNLTHGGIICLDAKMACKDGFGGVAFRENATMSFQQNAKNRKNRAMKMICGNMAPSKNIIRKRWFPHHGSAIEQRPTIQPTLFGPSTLIRLNHSFLLCIFFCSKAISLSREYISFNLHGR